jgi:putative acetyltransferase
MDYYLKFLDTIYLIALYEEKLVGHIFALPRVEELISHIVNIGYTVKSDYRNKRIGSILMQQLISKVNKNKKVKIMFAEVASDNIASQNLLRKYNFEEIGRLYNGFMRKNHTFIDLLYFSKYL